jgi:hypothetical protein
MPEQVNDECERFHADFAPLMRNSGDHACHRTDPLHDKIIRRSSQYRLRQQVPEGDPHDTIP